MANLAAETKDMGIQLEQVQGFTPTPMTVATVIYYSGYHPYTLKPTKTPKTKKEKEDQHKFFFWYKKENRQWIKDKLTGSGRTDLLKKLLPGDISWRKNKPGNAKNTFDDTVTSPQRESNRKSKSVRGKNKNRGKEGEDSGGNSRTKNKGLNKKRRR